LLFFLLRRFVERWIAIAAAAIFLVHPIQTSAVLYVYERSTLLACFFSLFALIALAERRIAWVVVFFALAFEGKESAIAVPLSLAILVGETFSRLRVIFLATAASLSILALALLIHWNDRTVGIGVAAQI